jgi:chromosome segregation ATPase
MALNSAQVQELSELSSRVEWLDEERRKAMRKLAELEQRVVAQDREIAGREQRIKELELQLSKVTTQLTRLPQVDTQLQQFKDEIVRLIEQYDQRRIQSEKELDRLRRVEHEVHARELAEIHREIPAIARLQNDMELRQAEESRLANLIGVQQGKLAAVENRVETWSRDLTYLEETERQNTRRIDEAQTQIIEANKRWEPIENRLEIIGNTLAKAESNIQEAFKAQAEVRQGMGGWMEQIQLGEYQRNQRLESWQRFLDEQEGRMEKYARDWIGFSDQFKEAKMAVQTLVEWQKQIEQRQREASELARVEANRMRSVWDNFLLEHDKKWKNFEVDSEQRWASAYRQERQLLTMIHEIEELLGKIQTDKDTLWRVQTAQADAMKALPRIWLESVEKAIAQNPNSRRQPALVPIPEE